MVRIQSVRWACALVSLAAGGWFVGCSPKGDAVHAGSSAATNSVALVPAEMRPMERTLGVLGSLNAFDQATVGIKTTGRLKVMNVDVGSVVKAGDTLAQIETRDYELRLQQAAGLLGQARARVGLPIEGTDDRVDADNINIVRETHALLDQAKKNLDRSRSLKDQGISSDAELEKANADYQVSLNRYEATLQDVRERQAMLAQRRAEFDIARQQLNDASVRAPFDGVVQQRLAHVGEFVAAGSPVLRLVRVDPLRLRLEIPERRAAGVQIGQTVRVSLEGDSRIYTGTIRRISPALDERTRMLVVEAELENPGHLRPGAFAKAEIVTASAAPTLAVPAESLVTFAGSEKVLLVSSNKVVERSITTGRKLDGWIEVNTGLKAGDAVIRNPSGLRPGDPVVPGAAVTTETRPAPGKNS
ncbi:MAG: efflux RND transporter periplasmic adaptor subunit [Verrucomicrobiota bacterium]